MKRILSRAVLLGLTIFLTSATTFAQQDQPQKATKHISLMRVENGKEIKLDTVIGANEVFVWNGDTIGGDKELKWVSEEGGFDFDSTMDFDIQDEGNGKVFVIKSGNKTAPMIYEFKSDDDSTKECRIKVIAGGKCSDMNRMKCCDENDANAFFRVPAAPHRMMIFGDHSDGNVIDLSDPGIISYEKKDLKGGKEKIVIVREKPSAKAKEIREKVIMSGGGPAMMHAPCQVMGRRVKVISEDDGKIKIMEDGDIWNIEDMKEGEKVIEKDGKKIIIKKIKEGDGTKVNVEVEEQKEEEK